MPRILPRTLDALHNRFALTRPFRIARGEKIAADVITVAIRDGDHVGRGEGVPYPRYGESVETTLAAVDAVRDAVEAGADRAAVQALLPPGAARNALDCALWDLEAKRTGTSVAAMLGVREPGRTPTALTVVIDEPEVMAAATRVMAGAPLIKIKVGADDPGSRIIAVRRAAPAATLIVDPNEGWDERLLRAMQPVLIAADVALLEQPVRADDDAWLEGFRSAIPICADEAVHTAADLDTIARRYQAVNVKLDKAGGLTAAIELAHAARGRGLRVMTGCMVSSSLSIAPALHVAVLSEFVDLDGPLWLREDREGGVREMDGVLSPPLPGFWGTP